MERSLSQNKFNGTITRAIRGTVTKTNKTKYSALKNRIYAEDAGKDSELTVSSHVRSKRANMAVDAEPLLQESANGHTNINNDTQEVKKEVQDDAGGTLFSTVLNLVNNIMGAGLLSLPHTFKDASIIGGTAVLIFTAFLASTSLILLAIVCEKTGLYSFKELGYVLVGDRFGLFLQIVMMIYTTFSCISFLILAGDFFGGETGIIHSLIPEQGHASSDTMEMFFNFISHRFVIVFLVTLVILVPLSILKNLHALRHTSFLSILALFYLVFFLISKYVDIPNEEKKKISEDIYLLKIDASIFAACPIINVAYICHYNGPKYYAELKDRSIGRYALAVGIAYAFCALVYFLVALFGYLSFGKNTNGDILTNFPQEDTGAIAARIALSMVVLFTYPLAFNALRLAAFALRERVFNVSDNANELSDKHYYMYTFALITLTFIPGAIIDDIAIVLGYKGAILGGCIGFAFTSLFFIEYQKKSQSFVIERKWQILNASEGRKFWTGQSYVFIAWALLTGVLGVIITTLRLIYRSAL